MISSLNRIEISVKEDTCVLLGIKGLSNILFIFKAELQIHNRKRKQKELNKNFFISIIEQNKNMVQNRDNSQI